jgi:hypothetical protein
MVRSNRSDIIADIDCGVCGRTHEAKISVTLGPWTALSRNSSRSSTVSCDLLYTCPCTEKEQIATLEVERPDRMDIRDVVINGWKSTGCEEH